MRGYRGLGAEQVRPGELGEGRQHRHSQGRFVGPFEDLV